MHRCRQIMVALPLTDTHTDLIRYAAMLAGIGAGVEFRFVCILPTGGSAVEPVDRDRLLASLEAEVRDAFAGLPQEVNSDVRVLEGPLLDQLLSFAGEQEADLLLVGHQPAHSSRAALARRLAMKAPCSVWMVPDGAPPFFGRMLVPIDFSEPAADALGVATSLARQRGLQKILALHVYFNTAVTTFEEYDDVIRGEEQAAFEKFAGNVDCHGVEVEPLFVEGANVAHAISRVVAQEKIDLVVMATRGRSRSSTILLGSETDQMLVETTVPILVVKHFGARLGFLEALLNRKFVFKKGPRFG